MNTKEWIFLANIRNGKLKYVLKVTQEVKNDILECCLAVKGEYKKRNFLEKVFVERKPLNMCVEGTVH